MNPLTTEPCYAVMRDDGPNPTIKVIAWTAEEARAQVDRLNALNGAKGCRYYWVLTRALRRD